MHPVSTARNQFAAPLELAAPARNLSPAQSPYYDSRSYDSGMAALDTAMCINATAVLISLGGTAALGLSIAGCFKVGPLAGLAKSGTGGMVATAAIGAAGCLTNGCAIICSSTARAAAVAEESSHHPTSAPGGQAMSRRI